MQAYSKPLKFQEATIVIENEPDKNEHLGMGWSLPGKAE